MSIPYYKKATNTSPTHFKEIFVSISDVMHIQIQRTLVLCLWISNSAFILEVFMKEWKKMMLQCYCIWPALNIHLRLSNFKCLVSHQKYVSVLCITFTRTKGVPWIIWMQYSTSGLSMFLNGFSQHHHHWLDGFLKVLTFCIIFTKLKNAWDLFLLTKLK